MNLAKAIVPYTDDNGLISPNPVNPAGTGASSDNGPLYTSEYYILLSKLGQLQPIDSIHFNILIGQCITSKGMLCRVPVGQTSRLEQADDYYGVLNGCLELKNAGIARTLLWSTIKHLGYLNNVSGPFTWSAFLLRQPQLLACMVSAAFPSLFNPLHYLMRLLAFPFYLIAAIVITTSCMFTPPSNSDARLLSWHLVQTTKTTSILCKLASLLWYKRLHKDYTNGMKGVATIYFLPHGVHPFSQCWVD